MVHKQNNEPTVKEFVTQAQKRFNLCTHLRSACCGVLIASIAALGVAAGFVLAGYRVPRMWFVAAGGAGVIVWGVLYLMRRTSWDRAAKHADELFGLKDGLISATSLEHQHRTGGIYALQAADTLRKTHQVNVKSIRFKPPWYLLGAIMVFLGISAWLGSFDDSPRVQRERAKENETLARTVEANEMLKKMLEELQKELSEEEKEYLKKSGIDKKIRELEKTGDMKEALRKYAKLERQINRLSMKSLTKQDERYLSQVAKEMLKAAETTELGKALQQKDYRSASGKMEKMKLSKADKAEELKERIERLKKMASKMSDVASKSSQNSSKFRQLSQELFEATEKMGKLEKECQGECSDEEAQLCNARLGKMSKSLDKLATRRRFLMKMDKLRDGLSECQGYIASGCKKPGGCLAKGIGSGKAGNFGGGKEKGSSDGLLTKVKGQKGQGPSKVAVSESATGAGASRVAATKKAASFSKQLESLVRREDLPDDLKGGVKAYFETIHLQDVSEKP